MLHSESVVSYYKAFYFFPITKTTIFMKPTFQDEFGVIRKRRDVCFFLITFHRATAPARQSKILNFLGTHLLLPRRRIWICSSPCSGMSPALSLIPHKFCSAMTDFVQEPVRDWIKFRRMSTWSWSEYAQNLTSHNKEREKEKEKRSNGLLEEKKIRQFKAASITVY